MERPLYAPVRKPRIDSTGITPAGEAEETDPAKLFEQVYVDPGPLRGGVRRALRRTPQVGLAELIARAPLTQGLAELVTYLSLQDEAFAIVYDDRHAEQVSWTEPDGRVADRHAAEGHVHQDREHGRMTAIDRARPVAGRHAADEGRRVPRHARARRGATCSPSSLR